MLEFQKYLANLDRALNLKKPSVKCLSIYLPLYMYVSFFYGHDTFSNFPQTSYKLTYKIKGHKNSAKFVNRQEIGIFWG